MSSYQEFIARKQHVGADHGFEPTWMPDMLFPFQRALVEWATRKGRGAIFGDCGLGKSFMQISWAENMARHTNGRGLILTPLAVAFQTVLEGAKLGVEVTHRRDGLHAGDRIVVTNYERLHHFSPSDFAFVVCDESSILKNFDGETKKAVTEFVRKIQYRLLCTATAAPSELLKQDVQPHWDIGKHLYWRALSRSGEAKAARLELNKMDYPKPDMISEA